MKANKLNLLGGLVLLTLGITSCATANAPINNVNKANNKASGNTEIAFNCIRGNINIDSIYANIGDTKTFTITPEENYSVFKVEFNGKEIKPNNNQYTITLQDSNYVRVLFDGGDETQFKYKAEQGDTYYTITDYIGPDNVKDICLPRTHNGYPVRGLEGVALFGADIDRLYIPESYEYVSYQNYKPIPSLYFYKEVLPYKLHDIYAMHKIYEGEKTNDYDGPGDVDSDGYNAISDMIIKDGWLYYISYLDNHCFAKSFDYEGVEEELIVPDEFKVSNVSYPFEYVSLNYTKVQGIRFSPINLYINVYEIHDVDYMFISANTLSFDIMGPNDETIIYYEGSDYNIFHDKMNVVLNCYNNVYKDDGHLYRIDNTNKTAQVINWGSSSSVAYIPETITYENTKYTVDAILKGAFYQSNVDYVKLNPSLKKIETKAFDSLAYLDGGEGLEVIEKEAFNFAVQVAPLKSLVQVGSDNTFYESFYLSKTIKQFNGKFANDTIIYTDYPKSELTPELIALGFDKLTPGDIIFNYQGHAGFDNRAIHYDLFINEEGKTNARITQIDGYNLSKNSKIFAFPEFVGDHIKVTQIGDDPFGQDNKHFPSGKAILIPSQITYLGHIDARDDSKIYFSGTKEEFNAAVDVEKYKYELEGDQIICHPSMLVTENETGSYILYQEKGENVKAIQIFDNHWIANEILGCPVVGVDLGDYQSVQDLFLGENVEYLHMSSYQTLSCYGTLYVNAKLTKIIGHEATLKAEELLYEGSTKQVNVTGTTETFNVSRYKNYIFKDIDDFSTEILYIGCEEELENLVPVAIKNKKVAIVNSPGFWDCFYLGSYDEGKDITWNTRGTVYYFSATKPTDTKHNYWHYYGDGSVVRWNRYN